ncbi:MAG: phage tail protein [Ghiorsea sp.]
MALDVNTLRSAVKNFSRPNLFHVNMFVPSVIQAGLTELSIMCKGASIPASTLGVIEVPFMGRKIKVPGDRTYEPWTLTIMSGQDWKIRTALEMWSELINTHRGNAGASDLALIRGNAEVHQVDQNDVPIAAYHLDSCWPSSISEMELNTESNDAIGEFTVEISYDFSERILPVPSIG